MDDDIFVGSLNIANAYSSVRYGEISFRDLSIILTRQPCKKVRDFFRSMLITNSAYFPEKLKATEINQVFDQVDEKYSKLYGRFYAEEKKNNPEIAAFVEETPPDKTEVTTSLLDMIKQAKHSIRIIQPYV